MTKITFLVGGLEPGANGVGDYSCLLAREIERQQPHVKCQIVALSDPHVTTPQRNDDGISQLRLPDSLSWHERIELARNFLDEFAPDWVSLQFVPYAFHPKGVVSGLAANLRQLVEERRLHIMFHELWIGETIEANLKERAVGKLQRHYVLQMTRQLRPAAIATSNGVYMAILTRDGFQAAHLPLFANIPIASNDDPEAQRQFETFWLEKTASIASSQQSFPLWTGVFFGALYNQWEAEPLLSVLIEMATQRQRRLRLMAIGRLGSAGEAIWEEMKRKYAADITFVFWGKQSADHVSRLLQKADFGISASPWQLIEKSSSTATILDHGLPVIVNRHDWHWRGKEAVPPPNDPRLQRFDGASPSTSLNLQKRAPQESLPVVAARFVRQLKAQSLSH